MATARPYGDPSSNVASHFVLRCVLIFAFVVVAVMAVQRDDDDPSAIALRRTIVETIAASHIANGKQHENVRLANMQQSEGL